MEVGYLIRELRWDTFEVSKWDLDKEPVAIYIIHRSKKKWSCDSPGCRCSNYCKHAKLIEAWLKCNNKNMPERMLRPDGNSF